MSHKLNSAIAVIGIDIGKNSFHVVGQDKRGEIVLRQKWSRGQVGARLANLTPCLIGMEACVGAHHLSRKLQALGHDARLMPAKYVRPYSKGQKNDFRDAEAIAEAVQRPTMRFVATKTTDQLDLQALHRVRERFVGQRTAIINQIRAFLLERGIAVRQGLRFLRAELPSILAKRTDVLSPRMLQIIEGLADDWRRAPAAPDQPHPPRFPPLQVFVRRPPEYGAPPSWGRHPKTFTKAAVSNRSETAVIRSPRRRARAASAALRGRAPWRS